DPDDLTSRVLDWLGLMDSVDLEVSVMAGGSNPHLPFIEKAGSRLGHRLRIVQDARDVAGLMAWADVAITAGGGTLWELMFLGCPVLTYSRNSPQRSIIEWLENRGLVVNLGESVAASAHDFGKALKLVLESRDRRASLSEAGRAAIDGKGGERVCAYLRSALCHP